MPLTARATASALPQAADVVVVGGGYTGLWTAYYLLRARPGLEVLVLEAEHVGFGASGRNGGWVSALWPVSPDAIARRHGRTAALAQLAALRDTVDEVGRVDAEEGLGSGFVKGGALMVARTPAQEARARVAAARSAAWDDGTVWLDAVATRERLDVSGARGATFTPHCARVHPRRLVDGLADAVRRLGGRVVEGARVAAHRRPGRRARRRSAGQRVGRRGGHRGVDGEPARDAPARRPGVLPHGRHRARRRRALVAGRARRPRGLLGPRARRHLRPAHRRRADRLRGPGRAYHWGSAIRAEFDEEPSVFDALRTTLRDLLPSSTASGSRTPGRSPRHRARLEPVGDVGPADPTGRAGGYVGDGVAASNLAGRTLADLVLGRDTGLTRLPWVGHRSPRWEPEPLRWLGVNAGLRAARLADREEAVTGRPARLAAVLDRLTAH